MSWSRQFRGRTFQWIRRFGIFCSIAVPGFQLIQLLDGICSNSSTMDFCNFQAFLIIIMSIFGMIACYNLTILVYNLFLKQLLVRRFPISCGHRKCIFTGKSSKTLDKLLLTIDKELPAEEVNQEAEHIVLRFLEDVREMLSEQIPPTLTSEPIFAGSVTERYGIPFNYKTADYVSAIKTDIDMMLCFDHEVMEASFSGLKGNILVNLLSPFLGFALLTFKASGEVISSKDILEKVKRAVSSTKVRNFPRIKSCFGNLKYGVNGPAVNISNSKVVDFDITPCIKCCEWPPPSDWPTRQRYWPSQEDVTRIVSHGCHLVAKPAPFDKDEISWRFSFSVAEVELSKLVPNTARKCLLALKIILKDHLLPVASISSYQLKTVFLNTLEKIPIGFWVDDNIERCFFSLLKEFHDALVSEKCLHYWFRSVNLFGKFHDPEKIAVLIKKLEMIAENPAPFIFDDGCCCLYPCCTRERLYDYRGRRQSSLDRCDDQVRICVDGNDAIGHANHAVSVESNPIHERDPGQQNISVESVDRKKVLGNIEQAIIINVKLDDTEDEIDGMADDDDNNDDCDERRPILIGTSSQSKYGAIKF